MAIGNKTCETSGFEFLAPTTRINALRVLRAMQLPKPGMSCQIGFFFSQSRGEGVGAMVCFG